MKAAVARAAAEAARERAPVSSVFLSSVVVVVAAATATIGVEATAVDTIADTAVAAIGMMITTGESIMIGEAGMTITIADGTDDGRRTSFEARSASHHYDRGEEYLLPLVRSILSSMCSPLGQPVD